MLAQFHWLEGNLDREEQLKTRLGQQHTSRAGTSHDIAMDMGDDCLEEVFAAFTGLHGLDAADTAEATPDWRITALGGAWTQRHRGQTFDAFRAGSREGSAPSRWSVQYHLGKSVSFDVSLYGASGANDMARAFAHRCRYYFDLYEQSCESNYVYTSEDHEHYQEPESFVKSRV